MSRFTVNLDDSAHAPVAGEVGFKDDTPPFLSAADPTPKKVSKLPRILAILGLVVGLGLAVVLIGGYFYWQSIKPTPAYSLAMLVDAARRDDKEAMQQYVDSDAAVDNFVPQITDKAVELYGKNLAPAQIDKVKLIAGPLMPSIKQRAKDELPRVIREKTAPFESIPYWAIALFAGRAVDITITGDSALVKSKMPEHPLELTMKKNGDIWKVVALKDDVLAQKIAQKIGQEMVAAATKGGLKKAGEKFGVQNLDDVMKNTDIFK
jgi:hypothetical protein